MDLNRIISDIPTTQPRCCVYVAIGSAAHMARCVDNCWSIEPQYEQQFPRFLRTLKTECPVDPVYIILIDPMLENPPFIVCNKTKQLSNTWDNVSADKYYDDVCNITVYALRSNVEYSGGIRRAIDGMYDITDCLRTLNTLAIKHGWFVVVQDYSGNNISELATLFEPELQGHLDHIVYGLNSHCNGGCYLDISKPDCDFCYIIEDTKIKALVLSQNADVSEFNAFTESIKALKSINDQRYVILLDQRNTYLRQKRVQILNILAALRSLHLNGKTQSMHIPRILCNKYPQLQDIDLMPQMSQYEMLFYTLRLELQKVGFSTNKTDSIILRMHLTEDPYKWIDIFSPEFENLYYVHDKQSSST